MAGPPVSVGLTQIWSDPNVEPWLEPYDPYTLPQQPPPMESVGGGDEPFESVGAEMSFHQVGILVSSLTRRIEELRVLLVHDAALSCWMMPG